MYLLSKLKAKSARPVVLSWVVRIPFRAFVLAPMEMEGRQFFEAQLRLQHFDSQHTSCVYPG
jgi:hypothetical protein